MAKKLSPLEQQIYESIQEKIYEKAIKTSTELLRKWRNKKGSVNLKQANVILVMKREQYKKLYRLSQTKFLHQHPNIIAQLRKDYEVNYGRKLKFVARGKTTRTVLSVDKKIRKRLLQQKYYYIRKQRKLAKSFDTAGFVSYEK